MTAYLVARDEAYDEIKDFDGADYDGCPKFSEPEPKCTSPGSIPARFLDKIRIITARELSIACSYLIKLSTIIKTLI